VATRYVGTPGGTVAALLLAQLQYDQAKFEEGLKAPASDVYRHEIPGGQYTNLRQQAKGLGLEDRWPEVCDAYAAANELFGDIVKVTPASKVVGDMALFLVANHLTKDDVLNPRTPLNFPRSVVEMLQGMLGQPEGGWPTRLQAIVRASDTVARMGGDEFTVLLPNVDDPENASLVAQKILKNISEVYRVEGNEIYITASVGITIFPNDGQTVDELLKNADTAMYHAKNNGRNVFQFYSQEMNVRTMDRLDLQKSLRHALERSEFILYYQPRVNIVDRSVSSMEALIRWSHPEKGMIMPDRFIPMTEETGMIVPIGEWVIRAACLQIIKWQGKGIPLFPVAVNVSAYQLRRPNFVETVTGILEETGVSPDSLEIELTESAIMQDVDFTIKMLKAFKSLGIMISIDDFGTGYSSLSQLKRFPIDSLKIDRSFIANITTNADDRAIVIAIISMAHSLGLNIIAEGVETEAQLALLSEQGCQEMQGYLFSKPLPPDLLEKLLQEDKERTKHL